MITVAITALSAIGIITGPPPIKIENMYNLQSIERFGKKSEFFFEAPVY